MHDHSCSLPEAASSLRLPRSSVYRWDRRAKRGEALVNKPGPAPVKPLDIEGFREQLDQLDHRRKKSFGSGQLHRDFAGQLSRRDIDRAILEGRREHLRQQQASRHRITWLLPNTAWAIDDTQFDSDKRWIQTIRDLHSRYTFEPLTGDLPHGEAIAQHLEKLFRRHGAPLILKRDNGSNLNHTKVNEVLARWGVIPLNSPPACPRYTGAIENAQQDWDRFLCETPDCDPQTFALQCAKAALDLNHNPRGVLKSRIPCTVYHQKKLTLNRRQRQKAFEQIRAKTLELNVKEDQPTDQAYRNAAQYWLHANHLITIRSNSNCYPVSA